MTFLQIIEYDTSKPEEIDKLMSEWQSATEGQGIGFRRSVHSRDHERSGHYVDVVEFDSYESAMANSARPETDAMSQRMRALCDGTPRFVNLDVKAEYGS